MKNEILIMIASCIGTSLVWLGILWLVARDRQRLQDENDALKEQLMIE